MFIFSIAFWAWIYSLTCIDVCAGEQIAINLPCRWIFRRSQSGYFQFGCHTFRVAWHQLFMFPWHIWCNLWNWLFGECICGDASGSGHIRKVHCGLLERAECSAYTHYRMRELWMKVTCTSILGRQADRVCCLSRSYFPWEIFDTFCADSVCEALSMVVTFCHAETWFQWLLCCLAFTQRFTCRTWRKARQTLLSIWQEFNNNFWFSATTTYFSLNNGSTYMHRNQFQKQQQQQQTEKNESHSINWNRNYI